MGRGPGCWTGTWRRWIVTVRTTAGDSRSPLVGGEEVEYVVVVVVVVGEGEGVNVCRDVIFESIMAIPRIYSVRIKLAH